MEIEKVREKRKRLESQIERLLFEFTQQTGCKISDLYFDDIRVEQLNKKESVVIDYKVNTEILI